MENELNFYKLSLIKNPRYILFLSILFLFFCANLFFFYFYDNYLFLIIAIIAITVFSYAIFKIQSTFSQSITLYDNCIEYKRSKFETERIYYSDIKIAGYYKKDLNNFNKYNFSDGLFLYDQNNNKYLLIGIGFNNYKDLYKKIEKKASSYKFRWYNIKRNSKSDFISEFKKIIQ